MYTKIVKVKKTSCKGIDFKCEMHIRYNTEEEKESKYQQYLEENNRRRANEMYEAERALHPCTMKDLEDIIDEYIMNVRDFKF